jgi:cysteine desulfurase
LSERFPDLQLNGPPEERLPNTLNVSIPGILALPLLERLAGVAAGAGAACHAGTDQPSAVLMAMGMPAERALGALRLTVGRPTTPEEVDQAVVEIADAVRAQQEISARAGEGETKSNK